MNKVYESDNMEVHDDREFITPEEAFEILYHQGKSIMIGDPPNFSAENEFDIYTHPWPVYFTDCISLDTLQNINKKTDEQLKAEVLEYLRSYELSR